MRRRLSLLVAFVASLVIAAPAIAETTRDRASAGGYLRIATRPDFQGGNSRLGYWNLYGRLLNEGNWAALELKLDMLPPQADERPWTNLRVKIEGGSVQAADAGNGVLSAFRASQLYVQAGNILLKDVTWQLGTLDYYFGDLGLYDLRPAQLMFETVGLSAKLKKENFDLLVGGGDSGWFLRGGQYNTIFTGAAAIRVRVNKQFELGGGGQYMAEPEVKGNRFAPYATPDVRYEDYVRKEVLLHWAETHTAGFLKFPNPEPQSSASWKLVGYAGFGGLGPIKWNSFFASFQRRHPEQFYTETFGSETRQIFIQQLTDERYRLDLGNEMRLAVIPETLDVAWGLLYGNYWDNDNKLSPSDDNRTFWSTVLRAQTYVSETVHLLAETSYAIEHSTNGNTFRTSADSIFRNTNGASDSRGFEYGDSDTRTTWQGKFGPVFNPMGMGIYTRPSIRLLYGVQWSSQNNAFGNSFVDSQDQYNVFGSDTRHWHHVLALEAEAWF